jgi:hypothetical protein
MAQALTESQRTAVALFWEHFRKTGEWPARKWALVQLEDRGIDLDADVLTLAGVYATPGGGSNESRIALSWRLATHLPDVAELFELLPKLIRLAVERLVAADGYSTAKLDHEDFAAIWGSPERGRSAYRALRTLGVDAVPWSSAQDGDEFAIQVDLEALRYADATSLNDLLSVNPHSRREEVGEHPHGKHRMLMRAVHQHLLIAKEWPLAVPFAVKHRNLGFVPDLVGDLHQTFDPHQNFIRESFGRSRDRRIILTSRAVVAVDDDGDVRERMLATLRAAAVVWRRWPDGEPIPLSEIARETGVEEADLVPAFEYLDWEPWCMVSRGGSAQELALRVNEKVRRARDVKGWDDYWRVFHSEEKTRAWGFVLGEAPTITEEPPLTSTPFDGIDEKLSFFASNDLRRIARDDLKEAALAYRAGAWKLCLIAAGAAAEAVLLDVAERSPITAASYISKKWPDGAGLGDLLRIVLGESLINGTTHTAGEVIAEYRNLVHPNRARTVVEKPSEHDAKMAGGFLHTLVANLAGAAQAGALMRYEQKG